MNKNSGEGVKFYILAFANKSAMLQPGGAKFIFCGGLNESPEMATADAVRDISVALGIDEGDLDFVMCAPHYESPTLMAVRISRGWTYYFCMFKNLRDGSRHFRFVSARTEDEAIASALREIGEKPEDANAAVYICTPLDDGNVDALMQFLKNPG